MIVTPPDQAKWWRRGARRRSSAAILAISLLGLGSGVTSGWLAPGPVSAAAVVTNSAALEGDFATLLLDVSDAPASLLGGPVAKQALLAQANLAHRRIDKSPADPCAIVPALTGVRQRLNAGALAPRANATVSVPAVSPLLAGKLDADVLDIQSLLLSSVYARACGGATAAPSPAAFPVTKVISSDNTQVTFHVAFPVPLFSEKLGDGVVYTQILSPGMGNVSSLFPASGVPGARSAVTAVGLPQLPVTGEEVAVPQGGTATIRVLHTASYLLPAGRTGRCSRAPRLLPPPPRERLCHPRPLRSPSTGSGTRPRLRTRRSWLSPHPAGPSTAWPWRIWLWPAASTRPRPACCGS